MTTRIVTWAAVGLMWLTSPTALAQRHPHDPDVVRRSGIVTQPLAGPTIRGRREVPWPPGWIVGSGGVYYPIVDRFGNQLAAAREAYRVGADADALTHTHNAAELLERSLPDATGRSRHRLRRAAMSLRSVARRMRRGRPMRLRRVDVTFVRVYQTYLRHRIGWEAVSEVVARPDDLFGEASTRFREGRRAESARQMRQAAGYMRLESMHAHPRRRAYLTRAYRDLEGLAARVERGQVRRARRFERDLDRIERLRRRYPRRAIGPTPPPDPRRRRAVP